MTSKKTITKSDLIEVLYNKIGYTKQFSKALVNDIFSTIQDRLQNGQGVRISGFGKFVLRDKKKRRGRNPQTGESLMIKPRRVVTFRPSLSMKNKFKRGL